MCSQRSRTGPSAVMIGRDPISRQAQGYTSKHAASASATTWHQPGSRTLRGSRKWPLKPVKSEPRSGSMSRKSHQEAFEGCSSGSRERKGSSRQGISMSAATSATAPRRSALSRARRNGSRARSASPARASHLSAGSMTRAWWRRSTRGCATSAWRDRADLRFRLRGWRLHAQSRAAARSCSSSAAVRWSPARRISSSRSAEVSAAASAFKRFHKRSFPVVARTRNSRSMMRPRGE